MQKKITVHVVKSGDKSVAFASAKNAQDASDLLAKFDIETTVEKEKRVVTL